MVEEHLRALHAEIAKAKAILYVRNTALQRASTPVLSPLRGPGTTLM